MTDDVATWMRFLERLEADLDVARTALERGDDVRLAGFVPPKDLPTLPRECAERAQRVLDQQRSFEATVRTKMSDIGTALASRTSNASAHHEPSRHGARFETRV